MMKTNILRSSGLAASALTVLAAAASAHSEGYVLKNESITGSYSASFGPSKVGGAISLYGRSSGRSAKIYDLCRSLIRSSQYGRVRLQGRLFGYSRTLGEVRASAYLANGNWYTSGSCVTAYSTGVSRSNAFQVLIGGSFVRDIRNDFDGSVLAYSSKPTVFSQSAWFWIGPIPVKLTARAGVGVYISLGTDGQRNSQLAMSNPRLELEGYARTWANGSASAGVDVFLASVSVEGSVRIANSKAHYNQGFRADSGAFGSLYLVMQPIYTILRLCVTYPAPVWYDPFRKKKSCETLWVWSGPLWTKYLKFY